MARFGEAGPAPSGGAWPECATPILFSQDRYLGSPVRQSDLPRTSNTNNMLTHTDIGCRNNRRPNMFTKTSIALAVVVALCSGAVAAEKRQNGAWNAYGKSAPVARCLHGVWDAYGARCDGTDE
jgi:hypothetical protein